MITRMEIDNFTGINHHPISLIPNPDNFGFSFSRPLIGFIWQNIPVPEPYQAGPEVELPSGNKLRNTVAGSYPPGRWHWEGYRGIIQQW